MRKKRMDLALGIGYSCGMQTTITLIARARAYLDARRGERTTLEELGRAVGASPFHLQRSFKRTLGRRSGRGRSRLCSQHHLPPLTVIPA